MVIRTYSAVLHGLETKIIEVEIDSGRGIPGLHIVGLASQAVREAKERITTALVNTGARLKAQKVTVNLAPAYLKKDSAALDLAIAAGLLHLHAPVPLITSQADSALFLGEIALDGKIKHINGTLPLVLGAVKKGFSTFLVPSVNIRELAGIPSIKVIPVYHLRQLLKPINPITIIRFSPTKSSPLPLPSIIGQYHAKRALLIAAAGGHSVLLTGPPGSGKTKLAQLFPHLLPKLTPAEAQEVTSVYSAAGLLRSSTIITRPFRAPHHSISRTGLLGGGVKLVAGEITLAHRGILFLDEIAEFPPSILDMLRQPLEQHEVVFSSSQGSTSYPAHFQLIAATNPCRCGYAGATHKNCICTPLQVAQYQKRLSGPLLDRFDLRVTMGEFETIPGTDSKQSFTFLPGASITDSQKQITQARLLQAARYQKLSTKLNASLTTEVLHSVCSLTSSARVVLNQAQKQLSLSGRGYFKVIKVAQTISDLEGISQIGETEVLEALQYRQ
ncbi:MAG: YifB family Mg chelatase-like AAA ATPase [bacterium]|nr:YifB family Mg chelatase-like AAA ATPase [bacterium]